MNYDDFFRRATRSASNLNGFKPMGWQIRLACGDDADSTKPETLKRGTACKSRLIDIPTGCGKTAGTVLPWIWNRVILNRQDSPRRLVYCLPMRTLVEQTRDEVNKWLKNLLAKAAELGIAAQAIKDLQWLAEHSPIVLMGGEELDDNQLVWDLYPDKPAIIIGTQDMLLSRALNRGYGMSRYRWPMHFSLLNNDCLWVLDEVQLMGSGLTTSLQLQAWREILASRWRESGEPSSKTRPTFLPTYSWWMSATAAEHWFKKAVAMRDQIRALWQARLTADPRKDAQALFKIPKSLQRCPIRLPTSPDDGNKASWTSYASAVAEHLTEPQNRKGKKTADNAAETEDVLTLVICNTVERAVAVYGALKEIKKNDTQNYLFDDDHLLLLHSRFRGHERADWSDRLKSFEVGGENHAGPRIIVATQIVEAGVDISASLLFTELCPLASLIQRLGRCARRASESGKAFWIDFEAFNNKKGRGTRASAPTPTADIAVDFADEQKKSARPYEAADIAAARDALIRAESAAAQSSKLTIDVSLPKILLSFVGRAHLNDCEKVRLAFPFDPGLIPQTRDLFNLFDTTPDLSGADIDVSAFIRDGEDLDVLVFWRDDESGLGQDKMWKTGPRAGCPFKKLLPERDELCPVPARRFQEFLKQLPPEKKDRIWFRDWRKGWVKLTNPDPIYPGQLFLLHTDVGGYDERGGWTGDANSKPQPCPVRQDLEETAGFGDATLDDEGNAIAGWQSIHAHSVDVARELGSILNDSQIAQALESVNVKAPLEYTPPWHDAGKAHQKFLAKLKPDGRQQWKGFKTNHSLLVEDYPAKAPKGSWKAFFSDEEDEGQRDFKRRPGFRHELASALALLELLRQADPGHEAVALNPELRQIAAMRNETNPSPTVLSLESREILGPIAHLDRLRFDLLIYLVACHHGKVRLGLRSTESDYDPDQLDPVPESNTEKVFRRCQGVQDGDALPTCRLPNPAAPTDPQQAVTTPELTLSLDPMETCSARYGVSWADRMHELLEVFGPFRLGYLETLIRAADQRASAKPSSTSVIGAGGRNASAAPQASATSTSAKGGL